MAALTPIEENFIARLQALDMRAFGELYDNYSAALFGIILKMVKSEELAEDILQNSFVKIWAQIKTYDPEKGRLFTWMLRVCRNTALDALKSSAVKISSKIQSTDSIVSIAKDGSTERLTDTIGVSSAVNGLDKEYQEVIELIYFQGYTHVEAAEALGIPLGTVKTRVRSALQQLRKTLHTQ